MRLRFVIALVALAALLAPMFAIAQDAPIPRPRRADRMPAVELITQGPAQAAVAPTERALAPDAATPLPASPDNAVAAIDAAVPTPVAPPAVAAVPQPLSLVARITDEGANIPDGIVWRVFDTARVSPSGDMELAQISDDATAEMMLPPGRYVVHVAYGRAQTTDTVTVAEGQNSVALVLDAGALRLNAAISGEVPIPINLLRFDIFATGDAGDRVLVAQNLGPNDIVTLNAGTYHVVSYFGSVNATVRADLRIEPGNMTDATLYHRAAQMSFKLVSEPNGEAIADIDWTVKTADGETIFTNIGAFPSTVLSEGDYFVYAKRGETVYNRAFQVQPGAPREVEVLTTVY